MTTKTIKPFRAWCPMLPDGGVPVRNGCVAMYFDRATCKIECDLSGGTPRRVTVFDFGPRGKATKEELARTHASAVRIAKRVLKRDGYRVVRP